MKISNISLLAIIGVTATLTLGSCNIYKNIPHLRPRR